MVHGLTDPQKPCFWPLQNVPVGCTHSSAAFTGVNIGIIECGAETVFALINALLCCLWGKT